MTSNHATDETTPVAAAAPRVPNASRVPRESNTSRVPRMSMAEPADWSAADAAGALASLSDSLRASERAMARAVLLAYPVARSGICEQLEGMPLRLWLANTARWIGSDTSTLLTASEVLVSMPVLAGLFAEGQVSWGQVRNICLRARRLNRDDRAHVDGRIEASVERWGGLDGWPPDELLAAADRAVAEFEDRRRVERKEQRRREGGFFVQQLDFDGGSRFFGEADAVGTALIGNVLDRAAKLAADELAAKTAADNTAAAGGLVSLETDGAAADIPDELDVSTRAKARYQALLKVFSEWQGGRSGRPAKPSVVLHVDVAQATASSAAFVDSKLAGRLPTLSAAWTELLATDADIRAVLFDGAKPLATSKSLHADDIPSDTRIAVASRDRGDRFPGSVLAAEHVHHVRFRSQQGTHHPDNLLSLADSSHRLVHDRHWQIIPDPDSGIVWFQRDGRRLRSLPRGTNLEPAPPPQLATADPPGDPP